LLQAAQYIRSRFAGRVPGFIKSHTVLDTAPELTLADAARKERQILFFTCVAHALTHVYIVIHQTLLTEMRDAFQLDAAQFARYATLCIAIFGYGALPAGWLGERFGEKRLLVAFFWLTAAAGAVLGLAQGRAALAAGMFLLGLATSIFHPVGNALIAKGIRAPGRAMGTNGLWGSLGQAVGPIFAVSVARLGSWRAAYLVLVPLMLALGVWLAIARLETPAARPAARPAPGGAPQPGPGTGARSTLPVLCLLLIAMMLGGFQFWMITHVLPTHLGELTSLGGLSKGELTSLVYFIGGLGQYWAGRLLHAREGRGVYVVVFAITAPLVYAVGTQSGVALVLVASLMSLFLFAAQPVENVLLSRFAPAGWKGILFGLKFALAFGVGSLGTLLSGRCMQVHGDTSTSGTSAVFTVASCFTCAALAVAVTAFLLGRRRQAPAAA
jgi:MFS family permease